MSIIENHDIVQMGLNIQAEKERCKKIIGEKNDWQEIPSDQREKILSSQRAQLITADRKNISLTMDHMILDKKEFKDEWVVNFGKTRGRKALRGGVRCAIRNKVLRKADEEVGDISVVPIDPMQINGFVNLRGKYQYFQIDKVAIRFSTNKSMNFAPILCKYFPPGTPLPKKLDPNYFAQLSKTALAQGSEAYMSLFKPRCNVQFNIGSTTQASKEVWVEMPYMSNTLMRANYDNTRFYMDYGYFIFVNRSTDPNQILASVEYKIDFYSGIDMNNLPWDYWGDDTPDEPPVDDEPSDGEGEGGEGGEGGSGEGGEGEGGDSGSGNPNGTTSCAPVVQPRPSNPRSGRTGRSKPKV